jgi:hypothetical protein
MAQFATHIVMMQGGKELHLIGKSRTDGLFGQERLFANKDGHGGLISIRRLAIVQGPTIVIVGRTDLIVNGKGQGGSGISHTILNYTIVLIDRLMAGLMD